MPNIRNKQKDSAKTTQPHGAEPAPLVRAIGLSGDMDQVADMLSECSLFWQLADEEDEVAPTQTQVSRR